MRVVEIDGYNASCEARGVERTVRHFMMQDDDIQVGDNLMIHVGYAIQKMTDEEARTAWEIYDEILAAENAASLQQGEA